MQFSYLDRASVLTFDPQYDGVHGRVTEPIGSLALVCASVRAWEHWSVEQGETCNIHHITTLSPLNISSPDIYPEYILT